MISTARKYVFTWDVAGYYSTDAPCPELGGKTTAESYRLLLFTLHEALEQRYGAEAADELFFEIGVRAGKAFFERYCKGANDLPSLAKIVQKRFRELDFGIVRFGVMDTAPMTFQHTLNESLDCSGLPNTADHICNFVQNILDICIYDEGFVKGVVDSFTGSDFAVREVECWASDVKKCRFRASFYG